MYWHAYKTKSENKYSTNEFVLVYSTQDVNAKKYRVGMYYLAKGIFKNYNIIINGKHFYDQPIDFDKK